MKHKLLIVDDEAANLRLLERLFSQEYQCLTASSGIEAIRLLEQHDVALLITDQRMPEMTGIELLKQTATRRPHMVRILLTGYTDVEALVEAINSGLVYMYLTKPWNNDDLKFRVKRAIEHYENNRKGNSLALANDRLLLRLKEIKWSIVASLTEMSANRSAENYEHGLRVLNTASAIAERMDLSEEDQETLAAAARLSPLAHTTISGGSATGGGFRAFIRKPEEIEVKLLRSIPELGEIANVLSSLRENFDGSGSPSGASGEQIPTASRILRIADEYNSLLRPRAMVATMTHEEAMRFLSQRAGKQFDPEVVAAIQQLGSEVLSQEVDPLLFQGMTPILPLTSTEDFSRVLREPSLS